MTLDTVEQDTVSLSFIVFSDDWGEHPSSCQHLFKYLATQHPVLWINTIGMRHPKFAWSDLRKIGQKVLKMLRGLHQSSKEKTENLLLHVCQPFMLPFNSISLVRKFNQYAVARTVQRYTHDLDIVHPILVSTVPNACDYISFLNNKKVVYYCVDDFTQWPGLDQALVKEMENYLVEKADILVATSQKLYQKLITSGKPTYLLTHGVDIQLFSQVPLTEHRYLKNIPNPRVGYFGLIDERSDQSLIVAIASKMKDISFVMTGPVATDVTCLKKCANIYFTGSVAYTELPSLIKGLDILFIPYMVNDFTDSISPLKLKEYLVTGKPVVTTPLAEARLLAQDLIIAATVEEWQTALTSSLSAKILKRQESILKAMKYESWENKARIFLDLCIN